MSTFATEAVEEVKNGKLSFYKLVIDGQCLYDEYCKEIEGSNHVSSLNTIRAYMNLMAENDAQLPKDKFNSIKENNIVIGYEFKKNDLRVYLIKEAPNVYIILGGYKKNQTKDIKKFSRIRGEFLESKQ